MLLLIIYHDHGIKILLVREKLPQVFPGSHYYSLSVFEKVINWLVMC